MPDRIELGRPYPEDCDDIARAMQDRTISDWLTSVPQPYGFDDAVRFVAEAGADEYAIRNNGRLIGMLRAAESFGIWLMPEFHGKGVAFRAAILGVSRYFLTGATKMGAVYLDGNKKSERLLHRLGFRPAGQVTAWSHALAREMPATSMELTKTGFARHHGFSLTTSRLRIDGFTDQDLPALHRIVTRPEVARMLLRFSPDMTRDEVAAIFTEEMLIPPMRLVIRYKDRVAGTVGILPGEPASIAYFLDPELAGQGLGQEAVSAFLDEYILRFAPRELRAEVFSDNPASVRILRNLGFQQEDEIMISSLGRDTPASAGIYRWRDKG
ncbi:GNAT family N-acetyltransferase [Paracoccus onubensis]|uniref:GNAT family N-acetyltransferase n=1 Tax=Paracoccus onubensis TaxID=1675788 RepID=UPI002731A6E0|nr:GNAT family N-acetyltransferase [Paracoccus onubensis]MDP0927244.1 GNAT family N-acetyltransferase [Paracoccus onubensis]